MQIINLTKYNLVLLSEFTIFFKQRLENFEKNEIRFVRSDDLDYHQKKKNENLEILF